MQELIDELIAISNTLEGLDLPPTIFNMDKLLGCQQHLSIVCEKLTDMMNKEKENDDGNGNVE